MSVVVNPRKPPPPPPVIVALLIAILIGIIYIAVTLNEVKSMELGRANAGVQAR